MSLHTFWFENQSMCFFDFLGRIVSVIKVFTIIYLFVFWNAMAYAEVGVLRSDSDYQEFSADDLEVELKPFGAYKKTNKFAMSKEGDFFYEYGFDDLNHNYGYVIDRKKYSAIFFDVDQATEALDNNGKSAWSVYCRKDHIFEKVSCLLTRQTIHIFYKDGSYDVMIATTPKYDFETNGVIRIDQNKPFISNNRVWFSGRDAIKLVEQMKSGKLARTRYSDYEGVYNSGVILSGFSEAVSYMKWLSRKME